MKRRKNGVCRSRSVVATVCSVLLTILTMPLAGAELRPGDILNQSTWQQAQGMMPDVILQRFQAGQHISKIIALPPEALRWNSKFTQATEANQGKYSVDTRGVLLENATGSYPRLR
jgi:hypothetical protein